MKFAEEIMEILAAFDLTKSFRGQWIDPRLGKLSSANGRPTATTVDLRPATQDLYGYLLRRYLLPAFGDAELGKISTIDVRRWLARCAAPN
jgi:hypothetical protein